MPQTNTVPIRLTADGVIRVGSTQVTLGTIVQAFNGGMTPEEIFIIYRAVALADIYEVIAFYLRHQSEVDTYICTERAESTTQEANARRSLKFTAHARRLLARLDAQKRRQG